MNAIFFLHLDVEVPCCCLVVYFGDLILGFLVRGDSGEGGVVGFWMMGDGVICAVYGGLGTVMVVGVAICSVYVAGGDVSFSDVVGCRHAGGGDLVVGGGGRLAVWATRQQRVQAASYFRPSSCRLVASCERSVRRKQDSFRQPSSREDDQQTCTHSGP